LGNQREHKVADLRRVRNREIEAVLPDEQRVRFDHDQKVGYCWVENREATIPGLKLPIWKEVIALEYQPWTRGHIVIDTAHNAVADCVKGLQGEIMIRIDAPGNITVSGRNAKRI
jgi:hypothetical protein